ncbi:carbohydrate kinase [Nanchangia anserum]|uniref:Carbohydrate kinase n=1 Tax=Nanchangia anserum TaxID=2692125 RepID=A0A8I0G7P8_9ACTO|nr:PfkB family carbohydrate kinase [Nanchangia anserum]MBD3689372.1 carbohydrate kinase [Nanchangia anserum]QOX81579.1 carbohydrate kinase [Nanchangia anserum]
MSAQSRVLCLGEALIDAVHRDGDTTEIVGGSLLNVAAGLAALGHDSHIASYWGRDDRGARLDEFCAERGISVVEGTRGASHTTVAHAEINEAGHATYTFDLDWDVPALPDLGDFAHLHTGSYAAALGAGGEKVLAAAREASRTGTVSYDPNIRPAVMGSPDDVRGRVGDLIACADIVKASDEDIAWLYPTRDVEEVMREWLKAGVGMVVATCGPRGALIALAGARDLLSVAPLDVPVADTVGAGDSFMAGLISGLLDAGLGGSVEAKDRLRAATWDTVLPAIHRATLTSGITVSKHGAFAPTREAITEEATRWPLFC